MISPHQTLAAVCSDHHSVKNFGGDLQELYTAVVAHGNVRKRKLSEQDELVATVVDATTSSGLGHICIKLYLLALLWTF